MADTKSGQRAVEEAEEARSVKDVKEEAGKAQGEVTVKKTAVRKTAVKTASVKKTAPRAAEKKAAPGAAVKKEPAKKAEAGKRAPKKGKSNVFIEFQGRQHDANDILAAARSDFEAKHKGVTIKSLEIYVKPEENAAYYVVNGDGCEQFKVEL